MEHITEILRQGFEEYGLTDKIDPWAITSLDEYCQRLLEKNQVMNLTAIRDPEGVARLHMLDSAASSSTGILQKKPSSTWAPGRAFQEWC